MRFGIVVDSACDLPAEFFVRHGIGILPISIRVDQEAFVDDRDPALITRFLSDKLGTRSVGWFSATLGSALDIKPILRGYRGETGPVGKVRGFEAGAKALFAYACARVRAGLIVPALCVSYGGDLAELAALHGYDSLRMTCAEHGVELLESPMSVTGMVNVGVGAVTLGFAAAEHDAQF